jgi:hypothetical protein
MCKLDRLFAAKLKSSGLTIKDAKALQLSPLPADEVVKLMPTAPHVSGMLIPYHDLGGKLRRDLFRVRLLETPVGAFGEIATKPQRYLQPKGSAVGAYLPRTQAWGKIASDKTAPIIITEGELKAACAVSHGLPTIGLGGVYSWRSAKAGHHLLPELSRITWQDRPAVICFDSDAAQKPQVAEASVRLARALTDLGARVGIATLPNINGNSKTGLDDFLIAEGREALDVILSGARCDELTRKLWEYNARYAIVRDPGVVYDEGARSMIQFGAFRTLTANDVAHQAVTVNEIATLKEVPVSKAWIEWPQRRDVAALTYEPGKYTMIGGHLNVWPGFACDPKAGDTRLWSQLLDNLFGNEKISRRWFEQWCAYPIRHPGTKLSSAVIMWSKIQGLGKSLIGSTLARIYGANYSLIGQRDLESSFNGWATNKQFVMVDDVSSHDSWLRADVLKKFITEELMLVNIKGIPTYQIPACANLYLTSNRSNALKLDDYDRRYFVHEVKAERPEDKFYDDYHAWRDSVDGPRALYHHLLHGVDLSDFRPHKPPPMTAAKADMMDCSRSEVSLWLSELKNQTGPELRLGGVSTPRELFTAKELAEIYNTEAMGRPCSVSAMGVAAREVLTYLDRVRVRAGQARYYAARNGDKWAKASARVRTEHVERYTQ